ncbi:helix-turn-helix domain-containing protein [Collinsella ihumii]|uniref:Helix-turn-helix domain-containing protein n=1 Tax=Collinsella ihumii TaxID=1720204 RepID=A0ABT7XDW4_9ACTN|nr:helix-turn-helix domain-containing protein [Collinsella ihumii]MDN0063523.1 helix-turn-helix domain-containing protein [Collinsella ihumii]
MTKETRANDPIAEAEAESARYRDVIQAELQQAAAQISASVGEPVRYRDLPNMVNPKFTGRMLGVNERTVTRMCVAGKLKAVKVMSLWRINRDALLEFAGIDPNDEVPRALLV